MDLSIYNIIKGPVVTDKAYKLNRDFKKLVLRIHPKANKALVRQALEKLFNVKVKNVGIILRKAKNKRVGKRKVQGPAMKKAIVTLVEGYSLDLFQQAIPRVAADQSAVKREKDTE